MTLPPTMLLQIAVSALGTAIGALALDNARLAVAARPVYRLTWRLAGMTFLLMGVCGLAQNAFGSWAILAGAESPVWRHYMRWAPALNYSRSAGEIAFLCMLLWCALRRGPAAPRLPGAWALLGAAYLVGAALGWAEGPLRSERHYAGVALTDALIFALWAMALSAAVLGDVVDRWLLVALCLAALPLPLNAIWFAWLVPWDRGEWTPRPLHMQLFRLAFDALVMAAVLHRWRLAQRGIAVQGLAGRPTPSLY